MDSSDLLVCTFMMQSMGQHYDTTFKQHITLQPLTISYIAYTLNRLWWSICIATLILMMSNWCGQERLKT